MKDAIIIKTPMEVDTRVDKLHVSLHQATNESVTFTIHPYKLLK